jgi:YidC/Oxa1 family membrane protein insertase
LILWQAAGEYLYKFLHLLYELLGNNWGLAIVAMTVIVRLILHPLNAKQMRSMQQMQRLQPRLKVLQEKYADDRDTLSRETMALYKENHVNPASGCLPLLIQLPILILLFNVLRNTSFNGASFLGIPLEGTVLSTLAQATGFEGDPLKAGFMAVCRSVAAHPSGLANVGTYLPITILLVLIIALTWLQQKMSSQGNEQMAGMNIFMPIFMGFICLSMPGGLTLYWMLSSLFAVIQQWYTIRTVAKEEPPTLFKEKPREGVKAEKAEYTPRPAKKEPKPAPRRENYDIPSAGSASKKDAEYDDFDSFIPRRHK